jgi:hypothetical protein
VTLAYVHADLPEQLYVAIPPRFEVSPGTVALKLNKALYGLKQSGLLWQRMVTELLQRLSYESVDHCDGCLFTRKSKSGQPLIIGLYVDDMPFANHPRDRAEMDADIKELQRTIRLNEVDSNRLLGIEIERSREGAVKTLTLRQTQYVHKICKFFGVSKPKRTVHTPEAVVPPTGAVTLRSNINADNAASAIGSLQWLANLTRYDISHAVNAAATRISKPDALLCFAIQRVFEYLICCPDLGLCYSTAGEHPERLIAFSDSDWAGDYDEGRSTSGVFLKFAGAAIEAKSNKQKSVALSSTEAEYIAAAEAARCVYSTRVLLDLLGCPQTHPTPLILDNTACIGMIDQPTSTARRRHINAIHHFVRKAAEDRVIKTQWIRSTEQEADILTKPLPRPAFERMRERLLGMTAASLESDSRASS